MRTDPEGVVEGFYQAFLAGDQAMQMAYFADDARFHEHIPADVIPYAGRTLGKAELTERLAFMYATWDCVHAQPLSFLVDGEQVTCQMEFVFRYKPTGNTLEGRARHIFRVVGGRIVRLDEYLDAALLDAFMRLNAVGAAIPVPQAR